MTDVHHLVIGFYEFCLYDDVSQILAVLLNPHEDHKVIFLC